MKTNFTFDSENMVTMRFLGSCYQKLGIFVSCESKKDAKQKTWKKAIVVLHNVILWLGVAAHCYSTVTRAYRYSPELIQSLFEFCVMGPAIGITSHMSWYYRRYANFLVNTESHFSRANKRILHKCEQRSKLVLTVLASLLSGSILGLLLESSVPLLPKEVEIRRLVYQTKHPQRRHPINLRFPNVDESESWAYEIIYAFFFYWDILLNMTLSLLISTLPVVMIHIKGQYEILAQFAKKIGRKHVDANGMEIFYTNIETNDFNYVKVKQRGRISDKRTLFKRHNEYDQRYIKQIIQFHQKLLDVNEKVNT